MLHALDLLMCAAALSCALAALLAYAWLPWDVPMYTGFSGVPSRERVPKFAYLIGIVPLLLLCLLFLLAALNTRHGIPPRVQVAQTVGDLLVLVLAWWGAAMVWNIAEAASGRRGRIPRMVMPFGPYAIMTLIVLGGAAFLVIH